MKNQSFLIFVLVAGNALAGQRLGAAGYGQASQYGGTSYGAGQQTQGYSPVGVNAEIVKRYSGGAAGGSQLGDALSEGSGTTQSQPRSSSLYPSTGSPTLQQPKAPK